MDLQYEEIPECMKRYFIEQEIMNAENNLLRLLRIRKEKFPSKINDQEWIDFISFVLRSRAPNEEEK